MADTADTAKIPTRNEMEKYKRVKKNDQLEKEEGREDVIRISAKGRTSNYVSYAAKLFSEDPEDAVIKDEKTGEERPVKKFDAFTIKATGQALATAVTVAEIIKRRFKGIHQMTKIGSLEVNDEYELKEDEDEKLDKTITQVRHISFIEITLSKTEPAEKNPVGYQPPLPEDQINVKSMDELIGETKGSRNSGGRGGGRGSGKGKGRNSNRGKGPKKGEEGAKSEGGKGPEKKDGADKADAGGGEKKEGEAVKKSRNSRNRNSKKKSEGGAAAEKKEGDAKSPDAKSPDAKKDEGEKEGGEKKNSRASKGKGKKGKGKGKKGKGKKGGDSDSDEE